MQSRMKLRLSACPWALSVGLVVALVAVALAVWLLRVEAVEARADRTWSECWRAQNGNSGFARDASLPLLSPKFYESLGVSEEQFFDSEWQKEYLRPNPAQYPFYNKPQELLDSYYHDGIGLKDLKSGDFTVVNRDSRMAAAVGIEWVPPDRVPNSDIKKAEFMANRNAMVTQGVSYEDTSTEFAMDDDQAKARHNRVIHEEGQDAAVLTNGRVSCSTTGCSARLSNDLQIVDVVAEAHDRLEGAADSCSGPGCGGGAARVFGWLVEKAGKVYRWVNPFLDSGDLVDSHIAAYPEKEVMALQPDVLPDTDNEGILVTIQLSDKHRQDVIYAGGQGVPGGRLEPAEPGTFRRFGTLYSGYMRGTAYTGFPHNLEAGEVMPKRSLLWEAHPNGIEIVKVDKRKVADLTHWHRMLTLGDVRWPVYLRDMGWYLYRIPAGGERSAPQRQGFKIITEESTDNVDLAARQDTIPKGFFESKDFIDALVGDKKFSHKRLFSNDPQGDPRDMFEISSLPTHPMPTPDPDSEDEFANAPDAGMPKDIDGKTYYFPFASWSPSLPTLFPHGAVLVKAGVASPDDGLSMSRFQFHIADVLRYGSLPEGPLSQSLGLSNRGKVPFLRFQNWPNAPLSPNHTHILVVTFYEAREAGSFYIRPGFQSGADGGTDFGGGASIPKVEYRRILCRVLVPPMGVAATEEDAWYTKLGRRLASIPKMLRNLPTMMANVFGQKMVESVHAVGEEGQRNGCGVAESAADFGGVEEGNTSREACDDFDEVNTYVECVGPAAMDCVMLPEPRLSMRVIDMHDESRLGRFDGDLVRNFYVGTPDDYQSRLQQKVTDTGPSIGGTTFNVDYIEDTLGLDAQRFPDMGCVDDRFGDCGTSNPRNRPRVLAEVHLTWDAKIGDYDGYVICIQPGHTAWYRYYYQGLPGMDSGELVEVMQEKDIDSLVPDEGTAFLWAGELDKGGWCRYFYVPRYVITEPGSDMVDLGDWGLRVGLAKDPFVDGSETILASYSRPGRNEKMGEQTVIPVYERNWEHGDLELLKLYLKNRIALPLGETHTFRVATYQGDLLLDGRDGVRISEFSNPLQLNAETLHCAYWEGTPPRAGTEENAAEQHCESLDLSAYDAGTNFAALSDLVDMGPVWAILGREVCNDILTSTNPQVTFNLPMVREGWGVMWVVAMLAIPIMMVWEASRMVYGSWFGSGGMVVLREFVPRLVLAVLLATASFLICQIFIMFSNQLTCFVAESFGMSLWKAVGMAFTGVFTNFLALFGAAGAAGAATGSLLITGPVGLSVGAVVLAFLLFFVLALLAAVLFMVMKLVIALLIRMLLLGGLILVSPVALLMVISPSSQHLASRWFSLFLATLFHQVAIVLVLYAGFAMINETGAFRGGASGGIGLAILGGLAVFLTFYLASKVSSLLSSTFGGVTGGAYTDVMTAVRTSSMVMMASRGLGRRFGGGAGGGSGGGP